MLEEGTMISRVFQEGLGVPFQTDEATGFPGPHDRPHDAGASIVAGFPFGSSPMGGVLQGSQ